MAGGGGADRSLQDTPTWAIAAVCAVFVIISVIIEHGIHSLGKWFQKRQKKDMLEALEKIKAELMLLGFISLLLTVATRSISDICIPKEYGNTMLPCRNKNHGGVGKGGDHKRKLLSLSTTTTTTTGLDDVVWHRILAAAPATAGADDYCTQKGKVSLISQTGVHQLHIFIFALAVFHVLYSVVTMALGQAKMKKWKAWESETTSFEYQFTNDPSRFRLAHQTSFIKRHSGLSTAPGIRWVVAFFRQFFGSVTKVDYLTMRNGFINAHFAPNSKFDFHKYIKRCMEDDFKVVVGISIPLWFCAIVFLLLNVYKWYTLTWLTIVPLLILLLIGTKLELVIMEMAHEIQERSAVIRGAPVVEPNNKFFWFNRPQWILYLIHYALFQNAFQMALFLWTVYEFGSKSCFHENLVAILVTLLLGVALQFICSYITFPLYSLVTQMGSHMKQSIFEEQTAKALKKWQKSAKERKKLRKAIGSDGSSPTPGFMSGDATPSTGSSPIHLLHKHKYHSSQPDIESFANSPISSYHSDTELSEMEGPPPNGLDIKKDGQEENDRDPHGTDFSFVRL